jgi:hypothetical protein
MALNFQVLLVSKIEILNTLKIIEETSYGNSTSLNLEATLSFYSKAQGDRFWN